MKIFQTCFVLAGSIFGGALGWFNTETPDQLAFNLLMGFGIGAFAAKFLFEMASD